jgi:hypothetical protein
MGPIVRLVSLVLILGTWWVMSGDTSPSVTSAEVASAASFDIQ